MMREWMFLTFLAVRGHGVELIRANSFVLNLGTGLAFRASRRWKFSALFDWR